MIQLQENENFNVHYNGRCWDENGWGVHLRGDRFGGNTVGDAAKHVCYSCLYFGLCVYYVMTWFKPLINYKNRDWGLYSVAAAGKSKGLTACQSFDILKDRLQDYRGQPYSAWLNNMIKCMYSNRPFHWNTLLVRKVWPLDHFLDLTVLLIYGNI